MTTPISNCCKTDCVTTNYVSILHHIDMRTTISIDASNYHFNWLNLKIEKVRFYLVNKTF